MHAVPLANASSHTFVPYVNTTQGTGTLANAADLPHTCPCERTQSEPNTIIVSVFCAKTKRRTRSPTCVHPTMPCPVASSTIDLLHNPHHSQRTPFPAHPIPSPGHQPRPPHRGPASSRPMTAGDVTRPRPNCRRIPLVPANSSTCSRPQNRTSRSLQEDAAAHSGTPCGQSTVPHVASKQQAADPREAVQVPQQPCGGCHRCHSSTGPTSWLCCQVWRRENCCNTRNTAAHKT